MYIEREMLAVTFGVKRFCTYINNRKFIIVSDHKPLEICVKSITSPRLRLQAMMLGIQGYVYKIKYVPSKDIGIVDAQSRLPNHDNNEHIHIEVNFLSFLLHS